MRKHIVTLIGCGAVAVVTAAPTIARAGVAGGNIEYPGITCAIDTGAPSVTINNGNITNGTTSGAYLWCPAPFTGGLVGLDSVTGNLDLLTSFKEVDVRLWCTQANGSYVWGCYEYDGGATCGTSQTCTGQNVENLTIPGTEFSTTAYDFNTVEVLLGGSPGAGNYSDFYGYQVLYKN